MSGSHLGFSRAVRGKTGARGLMAGGGAANDPRRALGRTGSRFPGPTRFPPGRRPRDAPAL